MMNQELCYSLLYLLYILGNIEQTERSKITSKNSIYNKEHSIKKNVTKRKKICVKLY